MERERKGKREGGRKRGHIVKIEWRKCMCWVGRVVFSLLHEYRPQDILNSTLATYSLAFLPPSSVFLFLASFSKIQLDYKGTTATPFFPLQMASDLIYTQNRNYFVLHAIWNSMSFLLFFFFIDTGNQSQVISDLK